MTGSGGGGGSGANGVVSLSGAALEVGCPTTFGPRVAHFGPPGGPNVFVTLDPDEVAAPPGGVPAVRLRGGHRLWTAPETPATYVPDDEAVELDRGERWVSVCQPAVSNRPLERTISVTVDESEPVARVVHILTNRGREPVALAPWAITQMPPAGVAVAPQSTAAHDELGLQANRTVVLWPYTQIDDPRLWLSDGAVTLRGGPRPGVQSQTPADHACKVGVRGDAGWVAHVHTGTVFVTRHERVDGSYPDFGAAVQVYTDHRFVEVETLGPLVDLEPDATVEHVETWELRHTDLDPVDSEELTALLGELDQPLPHQL